MARQATCHPSTDRHPAPRVAQRIDTRLNTVFSGVALGAALVRVWTLVFVALVGMASFQDSVGQGAMRRDKLTLKTSAGEKNIEIEVAETVEQKAMGLMFRTSLADTAGMLFPYTPPTEITMWMKNTFISLDMVFIKSDGTVHRIAARTEPLSEKVVASEGDCAAVLELAGGAAERLGLKAGDRVVHALFGSKPQSAP
jgi:uncharacterized protein